MVNASQGSLILSTVEYKGRLLYSKYNPSRAITSLIEKTEILKGTLVIIFSPVLWYGLKELIEKLPEDCAIIALEADANLEKLAAEKLKETDFTDKVELLNFRNSKLIEDKIKKLLSTGKIKRSLRIDFSAGIQFNRELYDYTALAIQDIIATFWKNRITLVKFGRLYSKNLISNLKKLSVSYLLEDVEKTVEKPLLVLGAGEGLDSINWQQTDRKAFFIIAVDAAIQPLLAKNIVPDAVVAMESQQAIEKVYTGTQNKLRQHGTVLFADLCSRKQIIDCLNLKTVFFASQYAEGMFFENLLHHGLLNNFITPMGSVGLAAVYIALKLKKNESAEIYTAGLDFSYSIGATHAKGTMAHKGRLAASSRLNPAENTDAAFAAGTEFITSKTGKRIVTTKNLFSYARQFVNLFNGYKNIYDCSSTGINLNIPHKTTENIKADPLLKGIEFPLQTDSRKENADRFIEEETKALESAKSLLAYGTQSDFYNGKNLEEQIEKLLKPREYLYLHFPDGYSYKADTSFLKRTRAEIDYFLKMLK